jgi:glycine C-acetyltransferase
MYDRYRDHALRELAAISAAGAARAERALSGPQGAHIGIGGRSVLNLCANDYLGLAAHPEVVAAAHRALDRWGYGLASVRFICGTQELHQQLEARLSALLGTEDTILYPSCFDANGGVFETLLGPEDAVISDELNHASIIDGIRLCKAQRLRYRNRDLGDLAARLGEAAGARFRLIVSDGVFSMSGALADLAGICALADRHDALVVIDDSHAVGVVGARGAGTPEQQGVAARVDLVTGTLGKALGGASGGYASGRRELIALLRQRSRPYLFSNTLAPCVAGAALTAIGLAEAATAARARLREDGAWFRAELAAAGFTTLPGEHPIVPVMIGDAALAARFADALLAQGVHAVAFGHPVVERGKARIRCQLSASHSRDDLRAAVAAFRAAGDTLGLRPSPATT